MPLRYVALLRGINVGGVNVITMAALAAAFEALGFDDVRTYIQSGNVVFSAKRGAPARLTGRIEKALSTTFDYRAVVVLRSAPQMRGVVDRAPPGFGADPTTFRYDVAYLAEGLGAAEAIDRVPTREGVDEAQAGDGVLYFSRRIAKASQSRLSKLSATPIYPRLTVRNWNTTRKLLALVEG